MPSTTNPNPDPINVLCGRIAYWSGRDTAKADEARRELAIAKMDRFVRNTIATTPPLSDEQRDRLALLLTRGAGA
jgi:hypothetical protein